MNLSSPFSFFPSAAPLYGLLSALFLLPLASCQTNSIPQPVTGAGIQLSSEEAQQVGRKIWKNECGGTISGLTTWNVGETFASLGIGHFIWYPAGQEGPFEESFPPLLEYMTSRGANVPTWLQTTEDCPWRTYREFQAAQDSSRLVELRGFLAATIELQTEFIVQRLQNALPKMEQSVNTDAERKRLRQNFFAVAQTPQGVYALIDYVNFKGEGTNMNERYRGQGWGLAQVLLEMEGKPEGSLAAYEFGESAKRTLERRIQNAPRDETQWHAGWMNRAATYQRPL